MIHRSLNGIVWCIIQFDKITSRYFSTLNIKSSNSCKRSTPRFMVPYIAYITDLNYSVGNNSNNEQYTEELPSVMIIPGIGKYL